MGVIDLNQATASELIRELRDRHGIFVSTWDADDVREAIAGDRAVESLSDEQGAAVGKALLTSASEGLADVLAQAGKDYLAEKWEDVRGDILSEHGIASPRP